MSEVTSSTFVLLSDLVASAQTGSGKTLAYLIPGLETLHRLAFTPRNGAGMIVIVPTRELSIQTYSVAREICKHHALTLCMVMGGASRTDEAAKLARGASIVIGTPGRLLDHLRDTAAFVYKNLQVLVIDEADRLLESGFEEELKQIIALLPSTSCFSYSLHLRSRTFYHSAFTVVLLAVNSEKIGHYFWSVKNLNLIFLRNFFRTFKVILILLVLIHFELNYSDYSPLYFEAIYRLFCEILTKFFVKFF